MAGKLGSHLYRLCTGWSVLRSVTLSKYIVYMVTGNGLTIVGPLLRLNCGVARDTSRYYLPM
jgi:hypothetical protein